MKPTPAWRVYTLGAVLLVSLTFCSRNFADRGGPRFMGSLAVAGVSYLLAVREFFRGRVARATPQFPRHVVIFGLILAAAWQVEFLRLPPGPDDDVHRYVWDGRLQRLGYNPYLVIPSDPAVKGLHTPETSSLNNPDLASPYPPGAQLFFRAISAIYESTFAFKVAFVICDLLIVLVLLDILRRNQQAAHLVLAFAWNPLLAMEVAGSGHIDIVGACLLVMSAAALARRWRATAAIALGLAVAVKFLPIVLLPLYWKRVRIRDAVAAAAVVLLLYMPFFNHGRISTGSLGTYVQTFRFNGPVFAMLAQVAPARLLAGLAVLAGLGTATWLRVLGNQQIFTTEGTESHRGDPTLSLPCSPVSGPSPEGSRSVVQGFAFAWPMAASLLFAPAVFPWYLLWLLPFLTSASTLLIAVWSVSIIPVYVQWHLRTLGRPWGALPGWVMIVEYGWLAAAAIISLRKRPVSPHQA